MVAALVGSAVQAVVAAVACEESVAVVADAVLLAFAGLVVLIDASPASAR